MNSTEFGGPERSQEPRHRVTAERAIVKEQLESLIGMMVERGILLDEAVTEFEKKFIKRVLERQDGNQSRAAKVLGIHRNTLSRKVDEYDLDRAGRHLS
jgi:Fis family transcriptional regulator